MLGSKIGQLEKRVVHVIYLITSVKQISNNGAHCFNRIEIDVIRPYTKLPFHHIKKAEVSDKFKTQ